MFGGLHVKNLHTSSFTEHPGIPKRRELRPGHIIIETQLNSRVELSWVSVSFDM